MTPKERIATADRASRAWDEFFQPMLTSLREEYTGRLTDIAATELHPGIRSDKITTLSVALKVLSTLESGMREAIRDGELAVAEKVRAERIEQMSDPQQRLLRIGVV